jgi:signal transduction histidine kinase
MTPATLGGPWPAVIGAKADSGSYLATVASPTWRPSGLLLEDEARAGGVQYVRPMRRLRLAAREYSLDGAIALLATVGLLDFAIRRGDPGTPEASLAFALAAVAALLVAVLARRRFPFAGPAAYWLLAAAIAFVDPLLIPFMNSLFPVGMAVAFLLGNVRDAARAALGLAVVLASAATIVYEIPGHSTTTQFFVPLEFGISWLAGFLLRGRAEQAEAAETRATLAERERDAAARVAVAEERTRIARELHDIVAHAVSVMVLQVGAVRHQLPEALEEDKTALGRVENAGRTALAEMRRLLGAMRRDGDGVELGPQPGLDGLDALLEEVDRAGLAVRLHVKGDAFPLPRAIDLSVYRIVQEGLTNTLKHARASHADVTLRYHTDELEVEVADDGAGAATSNGLGHGLVGIRERVKIFGGEMSAGAAPTGGFVLSARLPLDRYSA